MAEKERVFYKGIDINERFIENTFIRNYAHDTVSLFDIFMSMRHAGLKLEDIPEPARTVMEKCKPGLDWIYRRQPDDPIANT